MFHRFIAWLWGYWNFIDLISLVMFTIGVGLRFHPVTLDAARIVLALDLMVFYVRILHICSASKLLGPKLIMIAKMVGFQMSKLEVQTQTVEIFSITSPFASVLLSTVH